jgi:hypothetical protein
MGVGGEQGGEMTQIMYAHVNKLLKKIDKLYTQKKKKTTKKQTCNNLWEEENKVIPSQ